MSPKFISGRGNAIGETTEIRLLETDARSELEDFKVKNHPNWVGDSAGSRMNLLIGAMT